MRLQDLKKILGQQHLEEVISQIEQGQPITVGELRALDIQSVPKEKRRIVARAFYTQAKVILGKGDLRSALPLLDSSHRLEPHNLAYAERLRLLKDAVEFDQRFRANMTLLDMKREMHLACIKPVCRCDTLFQAVECRSAIEPGFRHARRIGDLAVYTVGPYHARCIRGMWTHYLKDLKGRCNRDLIEPLAEALATFILHETPLLATSDILVPVPPSTAKYSNRGFAPNDLLAEYLQRRLGLPLCVALTRKSGIPTREASDEELAAQFDVLVSAEKRVKGVCVLLVEDIWTTGRTISMCAEKLRAFGPERILAVALGKTC